MSGILEIKRIKDGFTKHLSFITLNQLEPNQKKEIMKNIYMQKKQKKIAIFCNCKSNPIRMTMGYISRTDTYYFRRFNEETHDYECYFHKIKTLSSDTIHENGWKLDNDGNYHVNLDPHDYKISNRKKGTSPSQSTRTNDIGEISISKAKASMNQIVKMMVTIAWNRYIRFDLNEGYPDITKIFKKVYENTSNNFYIKSDITFRDALFNGGKIGKIYHMENKLKAKTQPFVLLLLNNMLEVIDEKQYIVTATNPITNTKYQFTASSDIVEYANRNVIGNKGPFVVSGFVKTTGVGKAPEFLSLSLLPINDYGVPIESSYERQFYELLCQQKRIVERPIESKYYPKFNGLLPDGLLLDTNPKTIIEIFGVSEGNKEYHVHREFKINHYEKLIPSFNFWYWDAFNQSNMPPLPFHSTST